MTGASTTTTKATTTTKKKTMSKLIALTGPKGVGKSTYAKFIAGENGIVISFATPIKQMLTAIAGQEYIYGTKKNAVVPHLGVTGRFLMQTLGTEWGRETIDQDIWVNSVRRMLTKSFFGEYSPVIIDDLRFENEAKMVRDMGGEVWEVERKGFIPENDGHISEMGVKTVDKKVLI